MNLLSVSAATRTIAVHITSDVDGAVRAWLEDTGLTIVDRIPSADVVLTGPDGLAGSDVPVVTLGGKTGAGQLPRHAAFEQIEAALRAVAAGLIVHTPGHTSGFGPLNEPTTADLLTPREVEVLAAMGQGGSNKTIARQLGISLHTVKFYVEAIFRKLDAHSRAEAVAKGLKRQASETVWL